MKERDMYGVDIDDYSDEQWLTKQAVELIIPELPGTGQHVSPDPVSDGRTDTLFPTRPEIQAAMTMNHRPFARADS